MHEQMAEEGQGTLAETVEDQQSWIDVALLFSLFPFPQVKVLVLRHPASPLHCGHEHVSVLRVFFCLCVSWSLLQWTEKQSINLFEAINKAFDFSQNRKIVVKSGALCSIFKVTLCVPPDGGQTTKKSQCTFDG